MERLFKLKKLSVVKVRVLLNMFQLRTTSCLIKEMKLKIIA